MNYFNFRMMLCALCMMLFVIQTSRAEKIQYGKYITYEGKVDANKKPNGKGKLELAYKVPGIAGLETNKDVIEGVFSNGRVTDAKLLLARYNGPLWINSAKFKGTLEFSIDNDGSSITYTLQDGNLETKNYNTFIINSSAPLIITRIPHPDGCETKAGKIFKTNYNSSVSANNLPYNYFYPFTLSELGGIKNIRTYTTYILDGSFSESKSGTEYSVDLENGGTLSKTDDGISFTFPNKDFFRAYSRSNKYSFKKTFPEGVLSYEDGDYYLLTGNDGERKGYMAKTEEGTQKVFMNIMNATTPKSVGGTLYEGTIAELLGNSLSGNAQAQYDLAMALIEGKGVDKDEKKGRNWLNLAVKNGNENAIAFLNAEKETQKKEAEKKLEQKIAELGKKAEGVIKARNAGDAIYLKMEKVTDLSNLAMSNNLLAEAQKLTRGGNFIMGNFRLKLPISAVSLLENVTAVDPSKNFVIIEQMDFGSQGNNVLLTTNLPDIGNYTTYSVSGSNANILPGRDKGNDIFAILKGRTPCIAVGKREGKWNFLITTTDGITSGDLYRGMPRRDVEEGLGNLGGSSFKQTGKTSQYSIYSLYWLDLKKQYNVFGTDYHYQMRNDKKYGDFYFDAQGRLIKWIIF